MKEASGVKIGTQIGTKSNRLQRTERAQIGVSTKVQQAALPPPLQPIDERIDIPEHIDELPDQDFWTIMSRSFMALMTPTCKAVPIVRQGTLVYLTPTIVPYKDSDVRYTEAHISSIVSDLDLEDCDVELRGITDVTDNDYDHIAQIHSLIAAAKDKSKSTPKALDKTRKRSDYKNCDYWVVNEDKCVLVRHHVKQRQNLMGFRYLRGELPVDANRLTGHRETERFFADGTSDVIVDQDFRALDDDRVDPHTKSEIAPWRGRTAFKLKPLTGQALVKAKKAAEKFQAAPATTLQKDRFRLSQAKSFAKAKAKAIPKPALSDVPSSSHEAPPAQPIVSNPGVSSRGTEMQIEPPQKIDRKHMVTTKEGEKVIMNQLRSIREFNRSMKDLIVRLFYTVDSQTCQARTTDHWVQTPTHWIRMVHQERDDLIHPDKCPSPLSSADALAFGDTLIANRHTCVLESSDPECNGLEIDDHWCNYTDGTGVEKAPEIDPERKLGYRWCGFSVFQIASPIETERLVPEPVDVAARAPRGLRVPIEPTASERRQHELTHLPYRDWCQFCVKAKGRHAASKKQLDRQPVIQVDYCFHSTDPKLSLRKLLTAVDIVTGLGMTIVIPSKGNDDYAAAELKKFIYECGRTFGILQYDQESSLKALCTRVCAELGGLSIRAVPKAILRSKAPAIVPEAEALAEAPEEAENPEVQELIEQSRGEIMFDPQELSDQQREFIELQERPFQGTEISEPELPFSPGIRRPGDGLEEPQGKSQRIDPDTEVPTAPTKVQRISSLYAVTCHVASVVNHIAGLVGVVETTLKNGITVPVNVNMDHEELHQEIRLSEPVIWDVTREFPEEAQRIGMNHEMKSMKDFNVYTEVPIDQCSQEDIDNAIGVRWVKRNCVSPWVTIETAQRNTSTAGYNAVIRWSVCVGRDRCRQPSLPPKHPPWKKVQAYDIVEVEDDEEAFWMEDSAQATVEGDTWGEEQPDASQDEVLGEAEEQPCEDEEIQEEETELGEEALGEDGEPPPEEADLVLDWGSLVIQVFVVPLA
ncbi:hypothetical protein AK812_SmicGene16545 [Symbiodinium microadriaticum]|uniref:Integrase catalytic domain-containing protein n=1 Tax=Symbiodinium microadriaticum TaxID=2951 RepID=A0A1Q9DZZ7_SYMMI|nr:hypothetical protein AK812_SmicGene16545 [Symbiodinium microadriaticum]